jgi:hypothetical protein
MSMRCFMVGLLAVGVGVSSTRIASAAHGDGAAQRAADHAMNDLFMATKFEEAKAALEDGIQRCESGCSDKTRARLYRDLGVVYVTGFRDSKRGGKAFKRARALNPDIVLDPVITTPEVQSAFDASASGASAAPSSTVAETPVVLDEEGGTTKKRKKKHETKPSVGTDEEPVIVKCSRDDECEGGQVCKSSECVARAPEPSTPVVWLSIGFIQDVLFVSGSEVCTRKSQIESGYTCLRASGSQYHGTPLPGRGGDISFAPALATTRVSLSSYIPLFGPISGGVRMAYAFAGQGPQADGGKKFVFYQAEAIGAYWLTGDAFSTKHIGAFLQLSGGVTEIDGSAKVTVNETPTIFQAPGGVVPPASQLDNPPTQTLEAYKKAGSGFASGGIGTFLPFGSASGLLADLRFSVLFPTTGFAASLGVSGALGL